MKLRATLLTSAAALAIAAVPAQARGPWYVNVAGGANWVNDDAFSLATGPSVSADTLSFAPDSDVGFVISAAVGAHLNHVMDGLRVELEGNYRQNKVNGLWSSNIGSLPTISTGNLDFDETTWAALANVWWDFDLGGVRPYLGGGIGWAHSELDGTYQGSAAPNPNFASENDGFAWQLGGGIRFAMSPNVTVGVAYRYFSAPDVEVGAPLLVNGAIGNVEVNNHSVLLEVTFAM